MRKSWRSIVGWTILSAVALAASQEILYKTVAHVGERMGDRVIENASRIQSQAQQALVRPHKIQPVEPAMTDAERLEMRRKEEFENAFMASYEAPEECERWKSDKHMVECVNHRIRAKRAFQKAYSADREIDERINNNWVR